MKQVLVAILAFAGGGIALGGIPDENGIFHACVSKNGSVRLIDTAIDSCRANETAMSWSMIGPMGPPGPIGAGLRFVDANATVVGSMMDPTTTVIFFGETPVLFRVDPFWGLYGNLGGPCYDVCAGDVLPFYYQSSDCSGVPLVYGIQNLYGGGVIIGNPRLTTDADGFPVGRLDPGAFLYIVPPERGQLTSVGSIRWLQLDGSLSPCALYTPPGQILPLVPVVVMPLPEFVTPIRVSR